MHVGARTAISIFARDRYFRWLLQRLTARRGVQKEYLHNDDTKNRKVNFVHTVSHVQYMYFRLTSFYRNKYLAI